MNISEDQIQCYKRLFQGREDIYANRWEKEGKTGYMPAYFFDPYAYKAHKMKGGTFQNYSGKTLQPLTDDQLKKHLVGEQLIGIYPLLKDNTSWFIAVDFDEQGWEDQCKNAVSFLNERGVPAYLERSRSGNGGHIWIFFEEPYLAIRSRKILLDLLRQADVISVFDKSSSFDRLFPNQDFLSGKGFGNLIALPLHGSSLKEGNSCFVDPETLTPFANQWEFLKNIKRTSKITLENLYEKLAGAEKTKLSQPYPGKLTITLQENLILHRSGLPLSVINFLKEELNFLNTEFVIKKKMGKNTWGTDRYFRFVEETEDSVIIPRGMTGRILRFCRENKIELNFNDERKKQKPILFQFSAQLRDYQKPVIDAVSKKDMGVIVAPPGAGKTIIGLKIIAEKQQPALIVVHRKQLAEQWSERIQAFMGISKNEIGKIGQGKSKPSKQITIAMLQSLSKELEKNDSELPNAFGTVIVDECHHIPAETYRNAISKLNSYFIYGLTATPFRKYNDGKLIFTHLGEVIAEIRSDALGNQKHPKIVIRNTELNVPFNSKTDKFETLSKILIHDSSRNRRILDDISRELKTGKKVVVITERKEHIDTLNQYLKQSFESITLSGEDSERSRIEKWKLLKAGSYQVLITTGQFFGEGSDLQSAQCLFLVYPFSFEGKLIQYIGRVQRSEITPVIYDYRDHKIDYLNKLFLKRNAYYRKIEQLPTLFDEPENEPIKPQTITVDRKVKIPIEEVEFRYGTIAFKCQAPEVNKELEFEVENLEVRPEFDVLKPYFIKTLRTKFVNVKIFAEFEEDHIVSQLAQSSDLEKLNREVIEGVKFRFIEGLISSRSSSRENLIGIEQVQEGIPFYESGEDLLNDILKGKKVKHFQQLRYLAQQHQGSMMKLRFVLSPFSFVFLLSGKEQFHIVLETLDTEEATYLWHFPKNKQHLRQHLKQVDENLNTIRNSGRQVFLQATPANFGRILHDYSDERKGFVIWRDYLEERLK